MRAAEGVVYARCVNPVYDILPIEEPDMPFTTAKEMFAYAAEKKIPVWQAALDYEQAISGLDTKADGICRKSVGPDCARRRGGL